jgi:hypothetical protein
MINLTFNITDTGTGEILENVIRNMSVITKTQIPDSIKQSKLHI